MTGGVARTILRVTVRAALAWLLLLVPLAFAGCGEGSSGSHAAQRPAASAPAARSTPSAPASGPTLVAVGDISCAPGEPRTPATCHHADTAGIAARLDPDAVAVLGDLQYPLGSLAGFRGSYDPTWGRLKARTRPAVGNHEYGTVDAAGYFAYFGRRAGPPGRGWYSYELGRWHVVVLNSNCFAVDCTAGGQQERWLRADLARHPRRCTLAYWHHPRFSSGLHGANDEVAPLWRALQEAGADVVLSGHDHDYERFAPQDVDGQAHPQHGIAQFVVGTGGASKYPILTVQPNSRAHTTTFGVLHLTLGSGRYAWRFVGEAGDGFRDAGTARCR